MLKSIRLINWRSHADSSLGFRKGTNLLIGIMGAGKSSVLEGISFALFGTFPALERRKMKLENVLRLNEPLAKVILEFEWEGAQYRIERAIERSKRGTASSAEIYKNNSLVEHGAQAVSSYVQGLTAVDYDLFTRAIYSEQNNIDYFLTLDPRRRKEEMDALLGLDKFESARANSVSVINRVRSKREALEAGFSREKLVLLEGKEKAQAESAASLEAAYKKASGSCESLKAEAERASAAFDAMRKARELHERLSREEIRLSAQLESLKKGLEGKTAEAAAAAGLESSLASMQKERAGLDAELKAAEEQRSSLSRQSGSLEEKIKAAAEAEKKLEAARAELQSILAGATIEGLSDAQKKAESDVLAKESERRSLEREIMELAETAGKLKAGLSECPLCLSRLTDEGIEHVRAEKARLEKEKKERASSLATSLAGEKKALESLASRIRRHSMLSEKIASLQAEAKAGAGLQEKKALLEIELGGLMAKMKALREKSDALATLAEKARAELSEMKSFLQKKAESESVEKKLLEVKSELAKSKFEEPSFDALRIAAEKARLEAERVSSEMKSLQAQQGMAQSMLKLMRDELAALRAMEKESRSLGALEEELSVYKNALLETQIGLRESLADAINTAMNEIWPLFYPYRNYRALRLGITEKDYVFEVDDGGGWKGLETVASGGERACAALALRVALAMVLTPRLGWLILDEPTHNLDSEAVEMLASALQLRVPEVVNQTFVITHDEAFMGSEFASSYRLTRDKENNGETKVEPL